MFELTEIQQALVEVARAERVAGFTYETIYRERTREEDDGSLRDCFVVVGRRCQQTGVVEMY